MKKHNGSMLAYLNRETQEAAEKEVYKVELIDAEKILPNERNFYSIEGVEEMANSLAVSDSMPPLEVVDNGDGTYRLISGERRLSATLFRIKRGELDKAELPCHVLPAFTPKGVLSAEQVEMLHIILANNYRQKSPLDQLNEVKELEPIARAIYEEKKETSGEKARFRTFFAKEILDISESRLQRLQMLTKLCKEAQDAFDDGLFGKSAAVRIAAFDPDIQVAYIEALRNGDADTTLSGIDAWRKQREGAALEKENSIDLFNPDDARDFSEEGTAASADCTDDDEMPGERTKGHDTALEYDEGSEGTDDTEAAAEEGEADAAVRKEAAPQEEDGEGDTGASAPMDLSSLEAEEEAKRWLIKNLEELKSEVQSQIDACKESGEKVEAARWGVRLAELRLVIETIL